MKTKLFMAVCLIASFVFLGCDKEENVTFDDLPQKAQDFITAHFGDETVAFVVYDKEPFDKNYEVSFSSGNKVEFNKDGKWTDIDCKFSRVPDSVVPEKILEYVIANYENRFIIEIDRGKNNYEVTLDNDLDLVFNSDYNLIGLD